MYTESTEASTSNKVGYTQDAAQETEWDAAQGCWAKLKLIGNEVWDRKGTYMPIVTHLSDTASDFAAVIEFYIVARDTAPDDCGG